MKTVQTLIGALMLFASFQTGKTALIIDDSDIVANHYTYSLSFDDLNSPTKFNNDVTSQSNVSVFQEGSGAGQRNFVRATAGQTSASFIYAFDFSTTSFEPTSLTLTDSILVNTPTGTLVGTTAYSLDGTNWTTVRTRTSTGTTQTSSGNTTIDFTLLPSLPTTVYYRTTFSITGATFSSVGAQWDRVPPSATNFVADFTVQAVPEPSIFVTVAGGIAVLGWASRRRRH